MKWSHFVEIFLLTLDFIEKLKLLYHLESFSMHSILISQPWSQYYSYMYLGEGKFYYKRMAEFIKVAKDLEVKDISVIIELQDRIIFRHIFSLNMKVSSTLEATIHFILATHPLIEQANIEITG